MNHHKQKSRKAIAHRPNNDTVYYDKSQKPEVLNHAGKLGNVLSPKQQEWPLQATCQLNILSLKELFQTSHE
jgi:hypothetical protein